VRDALKIQSGGRAAGAIAALAETPSELTSGPTKMVSNSDSDSGAAWSVSRLVMTDFRNYAALELNLDCRPVVLTGANGAGKTNILEALSFLAPGRGLRGVRLDEPDRRDGHPGTAWSVAATLDGPLTSINVGTGRDPAVSPNPEDDEETQDGDGGQGREKTNAPVGRRLVHIDGQRAVGPRALAEAGGVVWLVPAMDRLFADAPSSRRRFLDRLVGGFIPGYGGLLSAYEKALRERTRLLRQFGARNADPAWLSALEEGMATNGVAVAAARCEMVTRLDAACARDDGPFPGAALAIEGEAESWLASMPALEAEDRLRAALVQSRGRDSETGGAAHGPHRSDLVVHHRGKNLNAGDCSTGEQKALLVSILLALCALVREQRGAAPLLLLDEVAAHLDGTRRGALFDRIDGLGVQAWMTGTDAAMFEPCGERAQFFRVAEGGVRPGRDD